MRKRIKNCLSLLIVCAAISSCAHSLPEPPAYDACMILYPGNKAKCYPENKPGTFEYDKTGEFIGGVWLSYEDYARILQYINELKAYGSETSGLK